MWLMFAKDKLLHVCVNVMYVVDLFGKMHYY
jgi:hypothetical protein